MEWNEPTLICCPSLDWQFEMRLNLTCVICTQWCVHGLHHADEMCMTFTELTKCAWLALIWMMKCGLRQIELTHIWMLKPALSGEIVSDCKCRPHHCSCCFCAQYSSWELVCMRWMHTEDHAWFWDAWGLFFCEWITCWCVVCLVDTFSKDGTLWFWPTLDVV